MECLDKQPEAGSIVLNEDAMTDRELIESFVSSGNEESFAELVKRHTSMVHATCCRVLRNAELAEDATQATFIVLARRARPLPPAASISGWLYVTALNSARELRRSLLRRQKHEHEAALMRSEFNSETSVDDDVNRKLDAALNVLPSLQRDALVLRYLNGLSEADTARELNVSETVVNNRVRHGMTKLREKLLHRGVTVSAIALSGVLLKQAAHTAPAGLAASVTAASLGKTAVSVSAASTAAKVLNSLTWLKIQAVLLPAFLTLAIGIPMAIAAWKYSKTSPPLTTTTPAKAAAVAHRESLFRCDFEDGVISIGWEHGKIVPGPERAKNARCLTLTKTPFGPGARFTRDTLYIHDKTVLIAFDAWLPKDTASLTVQIANANGGQNYDHTWHDLPHGQWTHCEIKSVDFRGILHPEIPMKDGDRIYDLWFSVPDNGTVFIDNIEITRETLSVPAK
jgi:RNA polymerase sigma factor (sigma-70 family)